MPPTIAIGVAVLTPKITIGLEGTKVLVVTLLTALKLNEFGVVSGKKAKVVTVKMADTPPMFTVALAGVEKFADDNIRTTMV